MTCQKRDSIIMTRATNQLSNDQLQTFLNIDHIRQHLIKVGLINQYGEVISKEEYDRLHKHHSRRRHSLYKNIENKQKYQTSIHRPMTSVGTRHSIENKQYRQSKSPDYHSVDRRYRTFSTSLSRQKNRSQSPTRLSSPNQSTRAKNISVRRTVSPKIIPTNNRCLVTMIYYGPQTTIDYVGDEIIVMQQHCGGENLIVYKGALKPNEMFQFESRRHSNYPFALAFYVNGFIDDHLSVCCESRYKHNVRIGGKRGLFGIFNVQRSKACRRCRFEQRMKKLAELKAKNTSIKNEISTPEPNLTRSTSPEPISTSHENEQTEILTSGKTPNHQRRVSIISPEIDDDDGITTITNQSNTIFETAFRKSIEKRILMNKFVI